MSEPEAHTFQVDLRGVVDLLGSAIYSSPRVYLRELLQNAVDAVTARRELDAGYRTDGITIRAAGVDGPDLVIVDDGIGLTEDEIGQFLATVGRSSKRDLVEGRRAGFLGQFGIGLLSAFMVADRITVRTRSAHAGPAVEWVGESGGTYRVRVLEGPEADRPVGTELRLTPRADESVLLSHTAVVELATRYGQHLPIEIHAIGPDGSLTSVTSPPAFLPTTPGVVPPGAASFGRRLIGRDPLATIALDIPETGTRGVAYVLPDPPSPGSTPAHIVHLGRMFLSDRVMELAPPWAFFVRCVVDTDGLTPTASREHLVDDHALAVTRDAIGARLSAWLLEMAERPTPLLRSFVATHYLALKALVLADEQIAGTLARLLPMETNQGWLSLEEIVGLTTSVTYAETTDHFRQVVALSSREELVVDCGHSYDVELMGRLPELFPGVTARAVTSRDVVDRLGEVGEADRSRAELLQQRAQPILAERHCRAAVRHVDNPTIPALLVSDPEVVRQTARDQVRPQTTGKWARLLGTAAAAGGEDDERYAARLVLNWANPLVRQIAAIDDEVVFQRGLGLLYLHAILAGGRPLTAADSAELTRVIGDLLALSLPTGQIPDSWTATDHSTDPEPEGDS